MTTFITGPIIVIAGISLLLAVIVQMLVGYRKIRFKGPLHMKVHKFLGWAILLAAVAHGTGGIIFVYGLG